MVLVIILYRAKERIRYIEFFKNNKKEDTNLFRTLFLFKVFYIKGMWVLTLLTVLKWSSKYRQE